MPVVAVPHTPSPTGLPPGFGIEPSPLVASYAGRIALICNASNESHVSGTTVTVQLPIVAQVGDVLLFVVATSGFNETISITDNSSNPGSANTSVTDGNTFAGGQPTLYNVRTPVTRQIETTDTITATISGAVTNKSILVSVWRGLDGGGPDVTTANGGTTGPFAPGTTAATGLADELVLSTVVLFTGTATTAGYFDTTAAYIPMPGRNTAQASANLEADLSYKIVNVTGTQTDSANAANITAWAARILTYKIGVAVSQAPASPPRPTIILAAATALQLDARRESRVITPRAPSTLPPAFARPPLPVVATARLARSQRHGSVVAPRPTTTLPAAFARPPLPVILTARLARAHQHGSVTAPRAPTLLPPAFARPPLPLVVDARQNRAQRLGRIVIPRPVALAVTTIVTVTPQRPSVILTHALQAVRRLGRVIAPRPTTTLPPAFDKPPLPVILSTRLARAQRHGSVVAPRPTTTLPAAFARPPQPVIVDTRLAASRRRGSTITLRPAALAVAQAVTVAPPRPAVILTRALQTIRRISHVIAPRPTTTLPAAFSRPPLPLVVDAVAMRRPPVRTGRAYMPRPVVLSIPVTRPHGIIVTARSSACLRRGRVAMPRPAGLATGGVTPPPSIIVTGSFNTRPRGQPDNNPHETRFG